MLEVLKQLEGINCCLFDERTRTVYTGIVENVSPLNYGATFAIRLSDNEGVIVHPTDIVRISLRTRSKGRVCITILPEPTPKQLTETLLERLADTYLEQLLGKWTI